MKSKNILFSLIPLRRAVSIEIPLLQLFSQIQCSNHFLRFQTSLCKVVFLPILSIQLHPCIVSHESQWKLFSYRTFPGFLTSFEATIPWDEYITLLLHDYQYPSNEKENTIGLFKNLLFSFIRTGSKSSRYTQTIIRRFFRNTVTSISCIKQISYLFSTFPLLEPMAGHFQVVNKILRYFYIKLHSQLFLFFTCFSLFFLFFIFVMFFFSLCLSSFLFFLVSDVFIDFHFFYFFNSFSSFSYCFTEYIGK